ncbi:MAG TPA: hypothetical protein VNJ07_09665 [Chitinophagales bacterium]|nr:hypothetical protein [Chitinophagales bacterium]
MNQFCKLLTYMPLAKEMPAGMFRNLLLPDKQNLMIRREEKYP